MKIPYLLIISAVIILCSCNKGNDDSLSILDKAIVQREQYDQKHMLLQDSLRTELNTTLDQAEKWTIAQKLEKIFYYHNIDSCHVYTIKMMKFSPGDKYRSATSKVRYANCLYRMDSISMAHSVFKSIYKSLLDQESMKGYCDAGYHIYSSMMKESETYAEKCSHILDEWWQTDSMSVEPVFYRNRYRRSMGLPHDSDIINRLARCSSSSLNDLAKINFYMAREYAHVGETEKAIDCYARSSAYDMQVSAKAYSALYELAVLLLQTGDLTRADKYMQFTLKDSYNSNYKISYDNITNSSLLIMKMLVRQEQKKQQSYLGTAIAIAVLLLISMLFTIHLRKYSTELEITRDKLSEVSNIKDHFLATYMEKCVSFLKKVDEYRSFLRKTEKSDGLDGLHAALRMPSFADGEFKDLVHYFDKTFLDIYPDFTEMVNKHMQQGHHLVQPSPETMSTELRILALMKMGITERYKIAHILNMSPKTIYPYLSKLKSHLQDPDVSLDEFVGSL